MKPLSANGALFIAAFEGFRPTAYNDAAVPPNATIGYGHLLHRGPVTGEDKKLYWGRQVALQQLQWDAAAAAAAVSRCVTVRLALIPSRAQARHDMLVSLCFNIGAGNFQRSSLLREINRKGAPRNWHELAPYWLEWVYAGSVRLPGLERRRAAELANFVAGSIRTY